MKLLTKTTLYFLLAMVPLLAAGGFFLFTQFSNELDNEMDQELIYDELQWIQYLQGETASGEPFVLKTPELLIFPVEAVTSVYPSITNTSDIQALLNKRVPYRQLLHIVSVNGFTYQITIRKSQVQKSVLVSNVTRLMLLVFAGLFVITLLFNWLISKKLWQPFRQSLVKIRGAELTKMEAVYFEETNIEEFNELNASLNSMAKKIHTDYINMKEFTENAAHEMQTPLAVVQSKMELLLQDSNLTMQQVDSIIQADASLKRLSKLNQSLLLLAKIENSQYETHEPLSLTTVIKKYLQLFTELIKDKALVVETHFTNDFMVKLHPLLADSLVSNLVGNAVKYNYTGGRLYLSVNSHTIQINNTSHLPPIDPQKLFKRFNKSRQTGDNSNGLGLAIVKKIADTHQLTINYREANGLHQITIEKRMTVNSEVVSNKL